MYNPFPLLTEHLLMDKIATGKRYFVRQSYTRGMQPRLKGAFLLRAYEGTEKALAEKHMLELEKDPYEFLYDVTNPQHLERLRTAARQPFGFKVYYAGKQGTEWKPPPAYREKIRHFIRSQHPDWRSTETGEKIRIGLNEQFGVLFLTFHYSTEEDRIELETIEKKY